MTASSRSVRIRATMSAIPHVDVEGAEQVRLVVTTGGEGVDDVEQRPKHRRAELELRFALGPGKLEPAALVFPETPDGGGPISPAPSAQSGAMWPTRSAGSGVPLHSLRHTHVSQLIDAGVDVVTISKRLGHASAAITLRNLCPLVPQGRRQGRRGNQCSVGEQDQNLIWGRLLPI